VEWGVPLWGTSAVYGGEEVSELKTRILSVEAIPPATVHFNLEVKQIIFSLIIPKFFL